MFVSLVNVECCVGTGLCNEPFIRLEESYRMSVSMCVCLVVCMFVCDPETSRGVILGLSWAVVPQERNTSSTMS